MPRHIHEETPVALICLLKDGKPAGSSVTFVVMRDKVEVDRVQGAVVADARARMGKAATAKYTPPKVADDKPSYSLTYMAIADGQDYKTDDEIVVWPREAKLNSRIEDGSKPLKNFKFKVVQNGAQYGDGNQSSDADPSVATFRLDKGAPFALEGVPPYEIVGDPEPQGGKLRDLKIKGKVNFVAEFVDPKRPADGLVKQYINVAGDPGKKGCDGKGHTVQVTVGVLGDRDAATGAPKPEKIGAPGIYVHVNVKFSGPANAKSKRNSPKTDLAPGLNLVDRTVVKDGADDGEWEIKGRVELAAANGVGAFKLELGQAGGDRCTVRIGSTAACGDASLVFTNWRRLWYEILAPDFMELEDRVLDDGSSVRDFAAGGRANLKTSGDATFIEYGIFKSHAFSEAEALAACKGSVMKREFFQRDAGPAKVYVLTDYTYQADPKPFDGSKGRQGILLKACDINLYNDGPGADADQDSRFDATTAQVDFDFPDQDLSWSPVSAYAGGGGADAIRSITWKAKITNPAAYRGRPSHSFEADVDDASLNAGSKHASFRIEETLQNPAPCTVVFNNPLVGHIATSLDSSAKASIDAWLSGLWNDAQLRPRGFALRFKVTGEAGNARRTARFAAIQAYIASQVNTAAPLLYKHLGLKPDGTQRSGPLDWNAVVNMDRSHHHRIAIDLPTASPDDPGSLAGALSATKCPITLNVKWEPQHAANGLSSGGKVLVKWGINCPQCITDTYLHEVGHHFGMTTPSHGLPGLPDAKGTTEDEPNAAYRTNGLKGHYYTGKGHSGGHCAYGLSDAHKALPSYGGRAGRCTLYGEGGRDDSARTRLGFCPQCQDILRATLLE